MFYCSFLKVNCNFQIGVFVLLHTFISILFIFISPGLLITLMARLTFSSYFWSFFNVLPLSFLLLNILVSLLYHKSVKWHRKWFLGKTSSQNDIIFVFIMVMLLLLLWHPLWPTSTSSLLSTKRIIHVLQLALVISYTKKRKRRSTTSPLLPLLAHCTCFLNLIKMVAASVPQLNQCDDKSPSDICQWAAVARRHWALWFSLWGLRA